MISVDKMSKRARKEYAKRKRVLVAFNTGTQVHKDEKHLTREQRKQRDRREMNNYVYN